VLNHIGAQNNIKAVGRKVERHDLDVTDDDILAPPSSDLRRRRVEFQTDHAVIPINEGLGHIAGGTPDVENAVP
jgi:hypothetical protein